jgi:hypothetical protein
MGSVLDACEGEGDGARRVKGRREGVLGGCWRWNECEFGVEDVTALQLKWEREREKGSSKRSEPHLGEGAQHSPSFSPPPHTSGTAQLHSLVGHSAPGLFTALCLCRTTLVWRPRRKILCFQDLTANLVRACCSSDSLPPNQRWRLFR